ncbi:Yip1 domain-containing protein [Capsaspora owczarzaki ATCC 30864]|uniref:Protein YIPF n=1 Tax=Capsaspora owczarzaki (strain ATCC 30864) TaxID=595528 RepID=A0A0D2WKY5_CAPO3|nr:Yip1 domain-containing protein [Capsaspora owczarzaki ATCC 30864]KJE91065.1 Yip1 domain-containing protein, variant 1 [Capsaspora owczarzaki ATCC 30864]|eukprot:XP_004349009.2 Yip1 domain-containing protein [Capsaspora owczarzaki ATCC 30864]
MEDVDIAPIATSAAAVVQLDEEAESTLDEPISVTLKRDLLMVFEKFFMVLIPRLNNKRILHDWDLWGPLILCVTLAMMLRDTARDDQKSLVFSGVFVIVWCGAAVVTLNSKLLGGTLSFFQSVCVLGYCLLPLVAGTLIIRTLALMSLASVPVRSVVVLLGLAWALFASMGFLGDSQPVNRKALAVYPMFLFYFVISWLIFVQPVSD